MKLFSSSTLFFQSCHLTAIAFRHFSGPESIFLCGILDTPIFETCSIFQKDAVVNFRALLPEFRAEKAVDENVGGQIDD